jgi:hypothetical protein
VLSHPIVSLGIDSWGVDYGLVDSGGHRSRIRSVIATMRSRVDGESLRASAAG